MATADASLEEETRPRSKLPLIVGIAAFALLAGVGFYASYSGLIPGLGSKDSAHTEKADVSDALISELQPLAFVPLPPILVSIPRSDPPQVLRLEGHLEVNPEYTEEVTFLMPRIMDVMNSYLRATELVELREPSALLRIRSHLLHRIKVVSGPDRVRDLLVTTFLVN